ncbi:MAG: hypothetical protein MZU84_01325 [Sphingobacterium sp.]|nr:hypothetical protein [Sphingobacterium sp.]
MVSAVVGLGSRRPVLPDQEDVARPDMKIDFQAELDPEQYAAVTAVGGSRAHHRRGRLRARPASSPTASPTCSKRASPSPPSWP